MKAFPFDSYSLSNANVLFSFAAIKNKHLINIAEIKTGLAAMWLPVLFSILARGSGEG